jgi:hypothetical protein
MPAHPAWDGLDDFLDPDDFASVATITLASGVVLQPVAGVLDEPGVTIAAGQTEMDSTRPIFTCKFADVAAVKRGDAVVIEAKNYEAHKKPHQLGDGMALLFLEPSL